MPDLDDNLESTVDSGTLKELLEQVETDETPLVPTRPLLVDVSYVLRKYMYVYRDLTTKDGLATGGFYGLIKSVSDHVKTTNVDRVLLIWDAPPYKRKEECQEYKADRSYSEQDAFNFNKSLLEQWLSVVSAEKLFINSAEGDDLIGSYIQQHKELVDVLSNDSDLHQCFDANPNIRFLGNQGIIVDKKGLLNQHQVIESSLREYLLNMIALTGGHNNAGKVRKGLGPKRASKLLDIDGKLFPGVLSDQEFEIYQRNRRIAEIPYPPMAEEINQYTAKLSTATLVEKATPGIWETEEHKSFLEMLDFSSTSVASATLVAKKLIAKLS